MRIVPVSRTPGISAKVACNDFPMRKQILVSSNDRTTFKRKIEINGERCGNEKRDFSRFVVEGTWRAWMPNRLLEKRGTTLSSDPASTQGLQAAGRQLANMEAALDTEWIP